VRAFGAHADGVTLDTAAISKAIAAANAAGGGAVVFPPGSYLSGTVELLSNVTLELQAGAVLQASPNVADYGTISQYGFGRNYGVDSSGEGTRIGLIVARNAQNIAITGRGRIDGNGDSFFDLKSFHNTPDFDAKYTRQGADFDAPKYGLEFDPVEAHPAGRPGTLIILSNCHNILIRDVTLSNAPNWTLHLQGSDQATINDIHISNDVLIPNNDGIDCMRSKNIHISDCDIRAGDDDFAIVSSEDVNINNCSLFSYSAAIRLEDTRYSTFGNLSIHANRGLAVFSRGEEHTAHVLFSNITMETFLITGHW
jgi:polygalacturonase